MRTAVAKAPTAPAPTLVIDVSHLPPETNRALVQRLIALTRRAMMARDPSLGSKTIAVLGPVGRRVALVFFQGLPGGEIDPSIEVCLNSAACALTVARCEWQLLPAGPLQVQMRGQALEFRPTGPALAPNWQLVMALPNLRRALPLGPVLRAHGRVATLGLAPTPYVFVQVTPEEFAAVEGIEPELEAVRRELGAQAAIEPTPTVPKLAAVAEGGSVDLRFRTRLADGDRWHPGVPTRGVFALAVAATDARTAVARLVGAHGAELRIDTPAGLRVVVDVRVNGQRAIAVEVGAVDVRREPPAAAVAA